MVTARCLELCSIWITRSKISTVISNGICLTNVNLPIQDVKSFLLFYAVKRKRDFRLEMFVIMLDGVPNSANVSCCFITVADIKETDGNNALLSFVLF